MEEGFTITGNRDRLSFDRKEWKKKLAAGLGNKKIKIISGMNKCGKTFVLKEFYNEVKRQKPFIHCLYIDTAQKVWNNLFWSENLVKESENLGTGPAAVFIDGIQKITDYPRAIEQLAGISSLDVFMTFQGIFSLVCPEEKIPGNLYEEHLLLPLSFSEIKRSVGETFPGGASGQKLMDFYLGYGGLPFLFRFNGDRSDSTEYLELFARSLSFYPYTDTKKIRNPESLTLLLEILGRKTGENLSAGEISGFFSELRETMSVQGVLDYIDFCSCRGIIRGIEVSEYSRKEGLWKNLKGSKTYYFFDLGLRNYFVSLETRDYKGMLPGEEREKRLKNCVFLELVSRGWKIREGKIKNKKNGRIDFVCTRVSGFSGNAESGALVSQGSKESLQMNERTEKIFVHCSASIPVKPFSIPPELDYREVLSPLLGINEGWKKILVTEEVESGVYRGINIVSVKDFLGGFPL